VPIGRGSSKCFNTTQRSRTLLPAITGRTDSDPATRSSVYMASKHARDVNFAVSAEFDLPHVVRAAAEQPSKGAR
jgi:hypothetical protein